MSTTISGLISVFLVFTFLITSSAFAQKPEVNITSVSVDFDNGTMTIVGENFDIGPNPTEVSLGGTNLNIINNDGSTIVVGLPDNLPPGDYDLLVKSGPGQRKMDNESITIGNQGPQGDMGDPGDPGDPGDQGPSGPQGPTGATGPQGPPGPAGAQGPQGDPGPAGPPGPKGDTGDTGAQGDTGDTGAKGDTGDTGAQGDPGTAGIGVGITDGASAQCGGLGNLGTSYTIFRDLNNNGVYDNFPPGSEEPVIDTFTICDGADGAQGADGADGADGAPGAAGHSAVVSTNPALGACSGGSNGTIIAVGIDTNDNTTLEFDELIGSTIVCDGADGTQGPAGPAGNDGVDGNDGADGGNALIQPGVVDPFCEGASGQSFDYGIDKNGDGNLASFQVNNGGVLMIVEEIIGTFSVCDGAAGADGADGSSGISGYGPSNLSTSVSIGGVPFGGNISGTNNCPAGKKVITGGCWLSTGPQFALTASRPNDFTDLDGWYCEAVNTNAPASGALNIWAVCADVQ